jgi:hypothetical protein
MFAIITNNSPVNPMFYNNTIVSPLDGPHSVYFQTGSGIKFKNNIIVRSGTTGRFITMVAAADTGAVLNHNQYYQVNGTPRWIWYTNGECTSFVDWKADSHAPDANSISSDPIFVVTYSNLHLQGTSPCIAAGESGLVVNDYDGVNRGAAIDIGAYEYVP